MRYSTQIKPISYLKAHASEMIRSLSEGGEPYIITQHGEAKAVVQSIEEYEREQEQRAFEMIMAHARKQYEEGKTRSVEEVFETLRAKHGINFDDKQGEEAL